MAKFAPSVAEISSEGDKRDKKEESSFGFLLFFDFAFDFALGDCDGFVNFVHALVLGLRRGFGLFVFWLGASGLAGLNSRDVRHAFLSLLT